MFSPEEVDDLESVNPWKPRGLKIHGTAEFVERVGRFGSGTYLCITPKKSWSWGIEGAILGGRGTMVKKVAR